jgi:hypothetical protein
MFTLWNASAQAIEHEANLVSFWSPGLLVVDDAKDAGEEASATFGSSTYTSSSLDMPQLTFKRNAHISYFKRCLTLLPSSAEGHDGNRITIAYFCLSALDLLGALESSLTGNDRAQWIRWVWALQASQ